MCTVNIRSNNGSLSNKELLKGTQLSREEKTEGLHSFQKLVQEQTVRQKDNPHRDARHVKPYGASVDVCGGIETLAQIVKLPATMPYYDSQLLDNTIQSLVLSTIPMGQCTVRVQDNIESMLQERNHLIGEQLNRQDAWDALQMPIIIHLLET